MEFYDWNDEERGSSVKNMVRMKVSQKMLVLSRDPSMLYPGNSIPQSSGVILWRREQ
jgi:hypothetical protein